MISRDELSERDSQVIEKWEKLVATAKEKLGEGKCIVPPDCSADVERLKKAISSLDKEIKNLDPKRMPADHIANSGMASHIDTCMDSINSFYYAQEGIDALNKANKSVDSMTNNMKPFFNNDSLWGLKQKVKKYAMEELKDLISEVYSLIGIIFLCIVVVAVYVKWFT